MLVQYTCVPSGEQVLNTTPIMDHVTSTSTVTFYAFYAYGAFLHTEDIIYYIYAYMPCMYVMVNNHLGLRWLLTSPILSVCCSAICSDIASKFPYSPQPLHCVNESLRLSFQAWCLSSVVNITLFVKTFVKKDPAM